MCYLPRFSVCCLTRVSAGSDILASAVGLSGRVCPPAGIFAAVNQISTVISNRTAQDWKAVPDEIAELFLQQE